MVLVASMVCPRDVYAARWTSDLAGAERIAELRQSVAHLFFTRLAAVVAETGDTSNEPVPE